MKIKHTPGPWRAQRPRGPQRSIDRKWEIVAPLDRGEVIIVGEHTGIDCLNVSNAIYIVEACNNYERIKAERDELAGFAKDIAEGRYAEGEERGMAIAALARSIEIKEVK